MDRSTHGLFAAFLLAVVLREVGVESDWLVPLYLIVVYLLLVVVASALYGLRVGDQRAVALFGLQTLLAVLIAAAVFRHARIEVFELPGLFGIPLAVIALAIVHTSDRDALLASAPYLLGYALVTGVFLYHVLAVSPTSGSALFPVFAAVVLGLSLFVVPRYIEESVFQLSLVVIATFFAVVGLATAVVGEYSIGGFEVSIWNMRSLPSSISRYRSSSWSS